MRRQTATNYGWFVTFVVFVFNPLAGAAMGVLNYVTDRWSKERWR